MGIGIIALIILLAVVVVYGLRSGSKPRRRGGDSAGFAPGLGARNGDHDGGGSSDGGGDGGGGV